MLSRARLAFVLATALPVFAIGGGVTYSRILSPGNQAGTVTAMTVDAAGNVYLTGAVSAPDFTTTPGVVQPSFGGGSCGGGLPPLGGPTIPCTDAFVTKLDPQGNIVFSTYLGGNGLDVGRSIAVDQVGNIYIGGVTSPNTNNSTGFPFRITSGAAYTQRSGSGFDGFIVKLDPSGSTLLYSTLVPGLNSASIAVDVSGSVYFAGSTVSAAFATVPATFGAYQSTNDGSFIGKLKPDGSAFSFATYFGHVSQSIASIAIDSTGNVYVAGTTNSNGFPATSGSFQANPPGPRSAFVAKLNATGSALVYASFLGGSQSDSGLQVRVDAAGEAVVLGIVSSPDFPLVNAFQNSFVPPAWAPPNNTFVQRFITKLSADGSQAMFSTFFPDADAIEVDAAGNTYVAGLTGSGFPLLPGGAQQCFGGGRSDVLLAQLSPAGALVATTYLGGAGIDGPGLVPNGLVFQSAQQAIAVGTDGFVYTAGGTNSTDFPNTGGGSISALSNFAAKLKIADPAQNSTSSCLSLAVSNSASFAEGPIAPGELITLRGSRLGPAQGVSFQLGPDGMIATTLAGVQVLFDGVPAPILYAQDSQVNAQAPFELTQPSTKIQVVYNGVSTNPATVAVQSAAPAIFHIDFTSTQGAIINQDNSLNSQSNPAPRGSFVSVYGTGGGSTSPATITGGYVPSGTIFLQPTLVLLGSVPQIQANPVYAGSAPTLQSGVFQIVFQVPQNLPPGNQFINITMGNVASTNPVFGTTISIK
jgi:uncharacterized protein (TIGR03437 family)